MQGFSLFEFEDQDWFPRTLRGFATDWLRVVQSRLLLYRPMVDVLSKLIATTGSGRIVDLCSGSGGPLPDIQAELEARDQPTAIVLTDRFPHPSLALPSGMTLHGESVDARYVPTNLKGCRTLFNGFHHFSPADRRQILKSAVDAEESVAVFEISERRLLSLAVVPLIPILVLLLTPCIRPFSWKRLIFTYVIPVVPAVCFWDGLVSHLRVSSSADLRRIALEMTNDSYRWEAGTLRAGPLPVRMNYLTGTPRSIPFAPE